MDKGSKEIIRNLPGKMLIIGFNNYLNIFATTIIRRMFLHTTFATFPRFFPKKRERNVLTHTIMQIYSCPCAGNQVKNRQYGRKKPLH